MKLLFIIKSSYGRELIYPACDTSRAFLKLIGQTTFTNETIAAVKLLGVSFEEKKIVRIL